MRISKKIKHLTEYTLYLGISKLLQSLMGIDSASKIFACILRFVGSFLSVSKMAKKNIEAALGKDINSEKILRGVWDNFGRFVAEFIYLENMNPAEMLKRIEFHGLENIEEFQKKQQPFLLFTGHFANWDFILKNIHKLYPKFGVVYRKANNPYMNKLIKRARGSDDLILIQKGAGGARALAQALKAKASIVMLVDQKMNEAIEVPFFSRTAKTANAIAKIALRQGYPIVPGQIIRKEGSFFKVVIHPPLEFNPKPKDQEKEEYKIMLKINQILENWIKEHPEQWLWLHKRW